MEACHEYQACEQTECVMLGRTDGVACWEVGGTLCSCAAMLTLEVPAQAEGTTKCSFCVYYRAMGERGFHRSNTKLQGP